MFRNSSHSNCCAYYLLFNSFSKWMCQNSKIISMFVSPFIFPRKKPNGFECPFEANGCTVDFVELFSTVPHISNTDVPSCIFHIFFLARVYAIIYCLCVSMLDAFVLHPKTHPKRRKNVNSFHRKEKTKSVRFHQNKSYGWKHSHRNGNRILSWIYENYFPQRVDFKYSQRNIFLPFNGPANKPIGQ